MRPRRPLPTASVGGMRVVVTGGAGDLGARVVRGLAGRGVEVVSASRRTGVDLSTGLGLEAVLADTDTVVHCADDTSAGDAVTVYGTRRLADASADRGIHLVHVSIVGVDDHPLPYYRRKLRAEQGITAAGGPSTVLRATQFHSLAAYFARSLTRGPVTFTVGDMAFQPVDTDAVAARLVDLALGPRPGSPTRARDLAGPDVLDLPALARLVRRHRGASAPRIVHLPPVGATMRAFARRQNVPAPGTADVAGRPFAAWLAEQPEVLTGR